MRRRGAGSPGMNTPTASTPTADTPTADTPMTNTPTMRTPIADTPTANTPIANTPTIETLTVTHPSPIPISTPPVISAPTATQLPSKLTLSNWARPAGISSPINGVHSPPISGVASSPMGGMTSPPMNGLFSTSMNGTYVVSPPLAMGGSPIVSPPTNGPPPSNGLQVPPPSNELIAPAMGIIAPAMSSPVELGDEIQPIGLGGSVLPLDSEGRPLPPISGPDVASNGVVTPATADGLVTPSMSSRTDDAAAVSPEDAQGRKLVLTNGIAAPAVSSPIQPYPQPLPVNGLGLHGAGLSMDAPGSTVTADELDVAGNGATGEEARAMKREDNPYFPAVSGPWTFSVSSASGATSMDVATPMPTRKQAGETPVPMSSTTSAIDKLAPAPALDVPAPVPKLDMPVPAPALVMVAPTPLPSGMNDVSIHGVGGAGALSLASPVEGSWMSTTPPGLVQGGALGAVGEKSAVNSVFLGAVHADTSSTAPQATTDVPAPPSLDGLTLEEEEGEGEVMFPTSAKPDVNAVDSVSSYHAFLAQWCFARGEDAKEAAAARGT